MSGPRRRLGTFLSNTVLASVLFGVALGLSMVYVVPSPLQIPGRAVYAPFQEVNAALGLGLVTDAGPPYFHMGAYVVVIGLVAAGIAEAARGMDGATDWSDSVLVLAATTGIIGIMIVFNALPIRYHLDPIVPVVLAGVVVLALLVARSRGTIGLTALIPSVAVVVLALMATRAPLMVGNPPLAVAIGLGLVALGGGVLSNPAAWLPARD